ncbi:hypothetical protein SPOG_03356 [Schizosaccharomyces cryophilus OY26]|uniref:Uncharacterized protein n=1 Tax=Schizosaccharomyces cryophilus (strain OY26 / ATCC MYA-4695 / CBS 11777 / NBRC 106824 / NRRL Y48691) TaxID=653667 RepID=S9VV08_SCHCR|nr:uncharacterized protein SPOG_03356 [Schizosaccharomyces cryophilus OY26]EPY49885.1 hypothetical protein SPOG_03356 [Schizosaccharomyces cryophilus OY26]
MPLNLLKHKSWNERVRRDEELARISGEQHAKRESENKLRRLRGLTELPDSEPQPKGKFANFWEQEEKREHDRQELYKKHGHELEIMKEKHGLGPLPWYMKQNLETRENQTSPIKRSARDDPMSLVESLLSGKSDLEGKREKRRSGKKKERREAKQVSPKERGSFSHKHGISKKRRQREHTS